MLAQIVNKNTNKIEDVLLCKKMIWSLYLKEDSLNAGFCCIAGNYNSGAVEPRGYPHSPSQNIKLMNMPKEDKKRKQRK